MRKWEPEKQRFEYLVVYFDNYDYSLDSQLDRWAKEGWRLVTTMSQYEANGSYKGQAILERPFEDKE